MLRHEAVRERMDTAVDMAGEVVVDLEDHEEVTVVAAADLWVPPLRLETGDAARGQVLTAVEAVAASEVEEVDTSESLHGLDVLLAM